MLHPPTHNHTLDIISNILAIFRFDRYYYLRCEHGISGKITDIGIMSKTAEIESYDGILLGAIHIHEGVPLYKFDDIQMVIWNRFYFLIHFFKHNHKFESDMLLCLTFLNAKLTNIHFLNVKFLSLKSIQHSKIFYYSSPHRSERFIKIIIIQFSIVILLIVSFSFFFFIY